MMWHGMYKAMPTISEDSFPDINQLSGDDGDVNYNQIIMEVLSDRENLLETLRATQEQLNDTKNKVSELERERSCLIKQLNANQPQVSLAITYHLIKCKISSCFFCHLYAVYGSLSLS